MKNKESVEKSVTADQPGVKPKGKFGTEVGVKYTTGKQLTPHQWGELIDKLRAGTHTQKELAKEYNVSVNAIFKKRQRLGGITIGESSVEATTLSPVTKAELEKMDKILGFTNEESSRLIIEAKRETFKRNEKLGKIVEVLIQKKIKDGSLNFSLLKDDIRVLSEAQVFFERQLRLTGLCLGFKDGDFTSGADLPELTIRKMNDADIIDVQSRLVGNDEDVDDGELLDDDEDGDYDEDDS